MTGSDTLNGQGGVVRGAYLGRPPFVAKCRRGRRGEEDEEEGRFDENRNPLYISGILSVLESASYSSSLVLPSHLSFLRSNITNSLAKK